MTVEEASPVAASPTTKLKKIKKGKKRSLEQEIGPGSPTTTEDPASPSSAKRRLKKKKSKQPGSPSTPVEEQAAPSTMSSPRLEAAPAAHDTASCSSTSSQEYCKKHFITVYEASEETTAFPAITQFNSAPFPSNVMKVTSEFSTPTPIQAQAWPIIAANRDMVGIAATGSGKTLAFLVPGYTHMLQYASQPTAIRGLVLAPTRELAQQIAAVAETMSAVCSPLSSICIFGGVPKYPQRDAIKQGRHLIVATPGRLVDFIEEGSIQLSKVDYLVLDEADRMLDMGFEPSVRKIVGSTMEKPTRRTVMFSATWPETVQKLAQEFLNNPICVTIGEAGATLAATHTVEQIVEVIEPFKRDSRAHDLLQRYHDKQKGNRILIFALYKKEAARVADFLWNRHWNVAAIHGDMTQQAREKAIADFKDGSVPLLVATDVAARGLDVQGITHVINYTFPLTTEDYVHRIGRTGRAGSSGIAHTFFQLNADKLRAYELVQVLKEANQEVPGELLKFHSTAKKKTHPLYGDHCANKFGSADMTKKVHVTFSDSDD